MQNHVKIYMNYFKYAEEDFIPCEACGKDAADIHHINGRGEGKDVIENLMALCRKHHEQAHSDKNLLKKSDYQYIHNSFLSGKRTQFLK